MTCLHTSVPTAILTAVLTLPLVLAGCGGGEDVTAASLRAARERWARAGVRDYDLEWTTAGANASHYVVTVRGGRVRTIESVTGGKRAEVPTAEPRYYGVEGLFLIIAEELAQLQTDTPFGQPRGTRAVLRFTPDPKYGYPRHYRRDVVGAPLGLSLDVVRFDPAPKPSP